MCCCNWLNSMDSVFMVRNCGVRQKLVCCVEVFCICWKNRERKNRLVQLEKLRMNEVRLQMVNLVWWNNFRGSSGWVVCCLMKRKLSRLILVRSSVGQVVGDNQLFFFVVIRVQVNVFSQIMLSSCFRGLKVVCLGCVVFSMFYRFRVSVSRLSGRLIRKMFCQLVCFISRLLSSGLRISDSVLKEVQLLIIWVCWLGLWKVWVRIDSVLGINSVLVMFWIVCLNSSSVSEVVSVQSSELKLNRLILSSQVSLWLQWLFSGLEDSMKVFRYSVQVLIIYCRLVRLVFRVYCSVGRVRLMMLMLSEVMKVFR